MTGAAHRAMLRIADVGTRRGGDAAKDASAVPNNTRINVRNVRYGDQAYQKR